MKKVKLLAVVLSMAAVSAFAQSDPIVTQSTSTSTSTTNSNSVSETTVKSPPPSAISPTVTVVNSDVCVTGVSGAAQTQILGLSFGSTSRDMNCERLKLSRSLYDMGMKVAAVATMCQDRRVFDAMLSAGTPCPVDGKIGDAARAFWEANPDRIPAAVKE
jgi:hypothetical protein